MRLLDLQVSMFLLIMLVLVLLFSWVSPAPAGSYYECAVTHEKAHCCGWAANHPGYRLLPNCGRIAMPPAHLMTCSKKAVIYRLDAASVFSSCGGRTYLGCSMPRLKPCLIILNKEM